MPKLAQRCVCQPSAGEDVALAPYLTLYCPFEGGLNHAHNHDPGMKLLQTEEAVWLEEAVVTQTHAQSSEENDRCSFADPSANHVRG